MMWLHGVDALAQRENHENKFCWFDRRDLFKQQKVKIDYRYSNYIGHWEMAYTHPFDIIMENYLLLDARHGLMIEGDLGRVRSIENIGTNDLIKNLEKNLMIQGKTEQIISGDEEIILHIENLTDNAKISKIVSLKHEAGCMRLIYWEASVHLERLRGKLLAIILFIQSINYQFNHCSI